jgi:hypothetical protein
LFLRCAPQGQRDAAEKLKKALLAFSDMIDGRGEEELPEVAGELTEE